jgi:hypothetical protein
MMIRVYVQRPNQPYSARHMGYASDTWEPDRIAWHVKLPERALIKAEIKRRAGVRRWVLSAHVKFVDRVGYSLPAMEADQPFVCPHCGKEI